MQRFAFMLSLLFLTACSGEPSGVRGSSMVVHVVGDDTTEIAEDFALAAPRVFVHDDAGGFVEYDVTTHDDGTFEAPDVPDGTYYLMYDGVAIVTDEHELDLGYPVLGRPRVDWGGTGFIELDVGVDGLKPWGQGDRLALYSAGTGASVWLASYDDFLDPGDTSYTGTIPYDSFGLALIDAGLGDRAVVGQLTTSWFGEVPYFRLDRTLSSDSLTMVPGLSGLEGSLTSVATRATLHVDWNVAAFEEHLASIRPDVVPELQHVLSIRALPQGASRGAYAPGLQLAGLFPLGGTVARLTESLEYGDPADVGGDRIVGVHARARVDYQLPGGEPTWLEGFIGVWDTVAALDGRELVPVVTPPLGLAVNGTPAQVDLFDVGLTPTVSWDAPAVGSPDYYTVAIFPLPRQWNPSEPSIFWIQTMERSVVVPPGVLTAGAPYALRVMAHSEPCADPTGAPRHGCLPHAVAVAFTGVVSP